MLQILRKIDSAESDFLIIIDNGSSVSRRMHKLPMIFTEKKRDSSYIVYSRSDEGMLR